MVVQGFLRKKCRKKPYKRVLPLRDLIKVDHLPYSRRLSRLTADMAAESSFEAAARRMKEHYSIEVPVSAVRCITLATAENATTLLKEEKSIADDQIPEQLVIEMDGIMVPVVDYYESTDRRKTKNLRWQEMKVGAAQDPIRLRVLYACSFQDADSLGDRLESQVHKLSGKQLPPIHGVGDGALWIKEQGERIGGCQYEHLVDFYHFCEYLHAAFDGHKHQELMVKRCKDEAKTGTFDKVVRRLKRELKKHPNHNGIIACLRYIKNRPGEFAYAKAISKDLPIGQGLLKVPIVP